MCGKLGGSVLAMSEILPVIYGIGVLFETNRRSKQNALYTTKDAMKVRSWQRSRCSQRRRRREALAVVNKMNHLANGHAH